MAQPDIDYTLYLVTDRAMMRQATLDETLRAACAGGVTLVQLREKHASCNEFVALAKRTKTVCDKLDVPLIINDNAHIAAEVGAAGVHVGQNDMPVSEVRNIVGSDAIVGVSVSTLQEALQAQDDGADYLGITMFKSATKTDTPLISRQQRTRILDATSIPCVLIGGINARTISRCVGLGAQGYAVVSAIMAADDPFRAACELREAIG